MMFCLDMSDLLNLGLLGERREQGSSDLGNRLLVDKLQALIDGVRAHNAAFAGVQKNATHARVSALDVAVLREEAVRVDDKLEGHVAVLEELDFLLHEGLVLFSCLLVDLINEG